MPLFLSSAGTTNHAECKPLFARQPAIVGMIHVGATPGAPRAAEPVSALVARALAETRQYLDAGVDGLLIENMHDVPYLCGQVGPEVVAAMTAVGVAVRSAADATGGGRTAGGGGATVGGGGATPLPLGVQILAAANREALAVALACGAQFIRVENFAYAHVADEGLMPEAEAGPLLRYRRQIGADAICIVADVKKKHSSHALTADVSLAEAARTTEFFGADGIIVTGTATGAPTSVADVRTVQDAVRVPVWVGSGTTPANLPQLWPHVDVFIVGSYFKVDGLWSNALDPTRLRELMQTVSKLRGQ